MILSYNILVCFIFIIALPFLPFIWLFSEKRRVNMCQRLGIKTGLENLPEAGKRIWVHALSVGEVISSVPLIDRLRQQYPSVEIVFTASTKTGFDTARARLFDVKSPMVDYLGYFPFDIPFSVKKVSGLIRPDAVVIVETDLWPGFLHRMEKEHVPVLLVNARLSERSLKGYLRFKHFSSLFFSTLTEIMVQSDIDQRRYRLLGIGEDKIKVTGNMKFDQPIPEAGPEETASMRKRLSIGKDSRVILCGSTHDGEEEILLTVFGELKKRYAGLTLIIAPRDPKRSKGLQAVCRTLGFITGLFSELESRENQNSSADVILIDRMGVLAKLYAVCDAAFIGGSMVRAGGHNPLEAAAFAKPVLFGADMSDFASVSELLKSNGGAVQVESGEALGGRLVEILADDMLRRQMGENSLKVFKSNSGAIDRIIRRMEVLGIV